MLECKTGHIEGVVSDWGMAVPVVPSSILGMDSDAEMWSFTVPAESTPLAGKLEERRIL